MGEEHTPTQRNGKSCCSAPRFRRALGRRERLTLIGALIEIAVAWSLAVLIDSVLSALPTPVIVVAICMCWRTP
jgi:hypothetical protein